VNDGTSDNNKRENWKREGLKSSRRGSIIAFIHQHVT
jgi:hypothetical protein